MSGVLWDELIGYYVSPLTPHADDPMAALLDIDTEEFEFMAARLFEALELPMPSAAAPVVLPRIETVGDFATFLQSQTIVQAGA